MIKKLVLSSLKMPIKKNKGSIFYVLAIMLSFSFACVLPGISGSDTSLPTETPTSTEFSSSPIPTKTKEELECLQYGENSLLAIVLASENGGLNVRDDTIENGGNIIFSIKSGETVEVVEKNSFEGWDKVRFLIRNETYGCGFVNNKYLLYAEKPFE